MTYLMFAKIYFHLMIWRAIIPLDATNKLMRPSLQVFTWQLDRSTFRLLRPFVARASEKLSGPQGKKSSGRNNFLK